MRAIEAAVRVLRREGVDTAFGVPGAAINPLYAALKADGGIRHILAAMSRARRTWPMAIRGPHPAISASASVRRVRREPT
jgi:Glyoxylate carboligase